jgi:hypothetical protein
VTVVLAIAVSVVLGVTVYWWRRIHRYVRAGEFEERGEHGGPVSLYYLDHRSAARFPSGPLDREGVILVKMKEVERFIYYPITIAQYGLGHYELFVETGNQFHRRTFLRQAEWIRAQAVERDGGLVWEHAFQHPFYGMPVGWVSAMAQGQCISLLLRAYLETNDSSFLDTASRSLGAFEAEVGSGGVMRRTEHGGDFYEEYPSEPPSFVLNGFVFSLWGLYEHNKLTKSERSLRLFKRGIQGLKDMLPKYDLGYWSRYDLFPANDRPAAPSYHRIHVRQLRVLAGMTGEEMFSRTARSWSQNERSWFCTARAVLGIARHKFARGN